jgi:flagellar hook-associated protein 2
MATSLPAVTSLGVGSGLNSEGIITSLMAVERRPVVLLQQESRDLGTQISAIGQLQSLTTTMRDKAAALADLSLWGQKSFTSSDSATVSGSATSSASNSSYSVSVQSLAVSQTVTSAALPTSASTLNEGSLTFEFGAWTVPDPNAAATGFTPKAGATPLTISIGAGETSLASIRDKINSANGGVTATIVNDASGARLSIRSTTTGEENGFRITPIETTDDGDPATGLSALGFDGQSSSNPTSRSQWATNAKATINGISVASATNTFDSVSDGLSITVGKVSSSPIAITVANDTAAVNTGIQDFVKAFNALESYIKSQTKYDAVSKVGGPLQGDRTTVGLESQLRGVINSGTTASSTWSRLSDVGISMSVDGTLAINSTKLNAALANPDELRKTLATSGSTTASSGFMDRFRDLGVAVLGSDGSLQTREDALNAASKRNTDRQTELTDRLAGVEARMRAQYQALDVSMSKLTALSSYVTQQFATKSSSSN